MEQFVVRTKEDTLGSISQLVWRKCCCDNGPTWIHFSVCMEELLCEKWIHSDLSLALYERIFGPKLDLLGSICWFVWSDLCGILHTCRKMDPLGCMNGATSAESLGGPWGRMAAWRPGGWRWICASKTIFVARPPLVPDKAQGKARTVVLWWTSSLFSRSSTTCFFVWKKCLEANDIINTLSVVKKRRGCTIALHCTSKSTWKQANKNRKRIEHKQTFGTSLWACFWTFVWERFQCRKCVRYLFLGIWIGFDLRGPFLADLIKFKCFVSAPFSLRFVIVFRCCFQTERMIAEVMKSASLCCKLKGISEYLLIAILPIEKSY